METYTLTINTVDITGRPVKFLTVAVRVSNPMLVSTGSPEKVVIPEEVNARTDNNGVCTFELLPSSVVGVYSVQLKNFNFRIIMPENDASLLDLVEEGNVSLPSLSSTTIIGLTQAQFDALTPAPNTFYAITDA